MTAGIDSQNSNTQTSLVYQVEKTSIGFWLSICILPDVTVSSAACTAAPSAPPATPTLACEQATGGSFAEQLNGLAAPAHTSCAPATGKQPSGRLQKKDNRAATLAPVTNLPTPPLQAQPLTFHLFSDHFGRLSDPENDTREPLAHQPFPVAVFLQIMLALTPGSAGETAAPAKSTPDGAAQPAETATLLPPLPTTAGDGTHAGVTSENKAQAPQAAATDQAAGPTDLAFAAKVQPSDAPRSPFVSQIIAASPAVWTRKQAEDQAMPAEGKAAAKQLQDTAVAAYVRGSETPSTPSRQAQTAPTGRIEFLPPNRRLFHPASSAQEIVMQISQPGSAKVSVQVVQQDGEVRVAVRTGDSRPGPRAPPRSLRFAGKLEESGFKVETWRPTGLAVGA